jgi:hypothetical protein
VTRDEGDRDLGADPGPDPAEVLRQARESKAQLSCLGCSVSGAWAVVALFGLVALVVYAIGRLL